MPIDWNGVVGALSSEVRNRFALDRVPFEFDGAAVETLLDLRGRVVLVTGGGGPDLGSAICRRLASQRANVAVLDKDGPAAAAIARDIEEVTETATLALVADVTDWEDVHRAIAEVLDRFGRLDVLINSAGGALGTHGPFAECGKSDIDAVVALNLRGVLYATQAALEPMLEQGVGRIVTIASEGGRTAMRDLAVYNACKAGVIALMRNLSREVGPAGVSTVTVCPGALVGPGLLDRMSAHPAPIASAIEQAFDTTSLGRFGLPDEVALLVAFLASDAARWIHGTEISISGGQSA